MGLASKLGTAAPSATPSAPPMPGGPAGSYGAPPPNAGGPPGYPQVGQQPGGQYGAAPPMAGKSQPGPNGMPQQTGPYGAPPGGNPYGAPPQNQPGQYGGAPGSKYGGMPGQPQGQYPPEPGMGQRPGMGPQPGMGPRPGMGQQPGIGPQYPQGQYGGQYGGQQQSVGGQYNQQSTQGGQCGAFSQPIVLQKLQRLVQENGLHNFYPPQKLEQVAAFVAGRDVEGLGQRWRLPREVTLDLVGLALYDICIYVDDSGSMAFEEGGERIDDMKAVLGRTADAATLFDTDGIVVRFMNSQVEGNGIHSEAEASNLVQQIRFSGTTPLGSALDRKVLQPMVLSQARSGCMQKPVLVICVTDGEPTGEPKDTVRQVIMQAKNQLANTPYGAGAVAFQFAQVGKDAAATRFLTSLDVDPVVGRMIDCTSYYEQEQEEYARKGINLDPSLYLVKLMVGGIDRSYDEGDE